MDFLIQLLNNNFTSDICYDYYVLDWILKLTWILV